MRGRGYGAFMDIVIGIIGGIIGGWIMRSLGFQGQGGTLYTILVATGGAVVLTWLVRLVTGNHGDRGGRIDAGGGDGGMRRVA